MSQSSVKNKCCFVKTCQRGTGKKTVTVLIYGTAPFFGVSLQLRLKTTLIRPVLPYFLFFVVEVNLVISGLLEGNIRYLCLPISDADPTLASLLWIQSCPVPVAIPSLAMLITSGWGGTRPPEEVPVPCCPAAACLSFEPQYLGVIEAKWNCVETLSTRELNWVNTKSVHWS